MDFFVEIAFAALDRFDSRAITLALSGGAVTLPKERMRFPHASAMVGPGSSGVEQRTENPRVGGSIPPLGTIYFNGLAAPSSAYVASLLRLAILDFRGFPVMRGRLTRHETQHGLTPRPTGAMLRRHMVGQPSWATFDSCVCGLALTARDMRLAFVKRWQWFDGWDSRRCARSCGPLYLSFCW